MISPIICITHAAFDEQRKASLERLVAQLGTEAPDLPIALARDDARKGSLWCWREAMRLGLEAQDGRFSHVIWLPDDAIVCKNFGRIIRACIAARPNDVFDCFVNHAGVESVLTPWWTCPDGAFFGFGGVFPVGLLREHLEWRERVKLGDHYPNDTGVGLWAMHTGRRIYKTSWTLVTHDTSVPSLDGNGSDAYRKGLRWADEYQGAVEDLLLDGEPLAGRFTDLPTAYRGNHWALVTELPPEHWTTESLDAMYRVARSGSPVEMPSVCILAPTYRMPSELIEKTRASVEAVRAHLGEQGIATSYLELRGDALVCRMRQRGVNLMLKSDASHLLWWDADIECQTPECVAAMIRSGHDVIAGAVPFKNDSGSVVCNLLPETVESMQAGQAISIEKGCLPVADAGTGFMLVSRRALYRLQLAHPELLHQSLSTFDYGEPLWALFDTKVIDRVYRSEDYYFCHLWRSLGEQVYVYEPARFRHWGLHGFEGSLRKQFQLESVGQ